MIDFNALKAPFPPDRISWRVGSTNRDKTKGMALAYIDARDVMERLDDVCLPENWQCDYPHANGKTVCRIGICVDPEGKHTEGMGVTLGRWVWKADGAGDTDFEANKGALSDAFKRAAVRWGIGRYLYDLPAPWVEIESTGKSYKIKESEMPKLMRLLGASKAPAPTATAAAPKNHGEAQGPLNITKLKEAMRLFNDDLPRCGDLDELNALLRTSKDILDQCERDLPVWYHGKEGSDVIGAKERIERKKAELSKQPHEMLKAG